MWTETREDLRRHGGLRSSGFWALLAYRYGRWGAEHSLPWLRWCHAKVYGLCQPLVQHFAGIDLDRSTRIGHSLHIVHGGMVHIHPRTVIGDRVGIMHGVTLGTNMGDDAPVVGNDVFIGCHASVLGGVKIGDGARVAANSLVISDVPPGAVAIGVPARVSPDFSALRRNATPPNEQRRASAATKVEGTHDAS